MTTGALRAWETRYGLRAPARTAGGQRLYRQGDVERVRAVRRLVSRGWSVAGAVSEVLGQPGGPGQAASGSAEDTSGQAGEDGALPPPGSGRRPLLDALASIDSYAVLAGYQAVRDLLRATTAGQVRGILVGLVQQLGGEVGQAALQDDTVMPVDLAFGEGSPLLSRAPSASLARMRLEAVLPLVVEDARVVVQRLQLSALAGTASQAGANMP
jgi:DNA-binding transcriptional MerR regulator